ncbi:uncharacterized protein LOC110842320 [Folsomia candida]|uniref:uncharacterized protein LOC110842320 n=1 Tax=Folsomia candida TaxID=158441 RepID=UPI001604D973|nr:uncharacterized protein LOC110842320 [Folsomia candida]
MKKYFWFSAICFLSICLQIYLINGETPTTMFKGFLENCDKESSNCFGLKLSGDTNANCIKNKDCHYAYAFSDNGTHFTIRDYQRYESKGKKKFPIISHANLIKFYNCNETKCTCASGKKSMTTKDFIGVIYFDYEHCHNETTPVTESMGTARQLKSELKFKCDRDIDPSKQGWGFGDGYFRFGKDNTTIGTLVGSSSGGFYLKNGTRIDVDWKQTMLMVKPIQDGFLYTNFNKSRSC